VDGISSLKGEAFNYPHYLAHAYGMMKLIIQCQEAVRRLEASPSIREETLMAEERLIRNRYNPVLGEFFRCSYFYPDGSEGYYLAEQVSHHPVRTKIFAPSLFELRRYRVSCDRT
jgi:hypothetical protein